jgi:hypothetical protein
VLEPHDKEELDLVVQRQPEQQHVRKALKQREHGQHYPVGQPPRVLAFGGLAFKGFKRLVGWVAAEDRGKKRILNAYLTVFQGLFGVRIEPSAEFGMGKHAQGFFVCRMSKSNQGNDDTFGIGVSFCTYASPAIVLEIQIRK